jgi:uncharacterized RDD family membrane protein YckC
MNSRISIDLTAQVTTPENIQFEYRIAGPFRRLPAFFLDLVIRAAMLNAVVIVLACSGILPTLGLPSSLLAPLFLIFTFLLDWFYGLVFETYWNGKTPGKWMSKIRVISADGRPISAYQATVRNFLRLADLGPYLSLELFDPDLPPVYAIPTGLVAFFCMAITQRFQRLGDLAAGTMVVVDQRAWVPPTVKIEDPRAEALAQHIPPSFRMSRTMSRVIALYAERRTRMPPARRAELASILAKPLLAQFGFREDTSADLLLCSLYYREFVLKQTDASERLKARSMLAAPPPPPELQPESMRQQPGATTVQHNKRRVE